MIETADENITIKKEFILPVKDNVIIPLHICNYFQKDYDRVIKKIKK